MDIGGTIKRFRKINNLEQKELAKLLNVSDRTVSSWETNRTQPKMEIIEELCRIFKCQKSDFLDDPPVSSIAPVGIKDISKENVTSIDLTDDERTLIGSYRMLSDQDRAQLRQFIRVMLYMHRLEDLGKKD